MATVPLPNPRQLGPHRTLKHQRGAARMIHIEGGLAVASGQTQRGDRVRWNNKAIEWNPLSQAHWKG